MEIKKISHRIHDNEYFEHLAYLFEIEFGSRKGKITLFDMTNADGCICCPDYIIAIQVMIKSGNSYTVNRKYLNSILFGIKNITIDSELLDRLPLIKKQIEDDLIAYRERFGLYLNQNQKLANALPIVYMTENNIEGLYSDFIITSTDSTNTLIHKAAIQSLTGKGNVAYDTLNTDISCIISTIEKVFNYSADCHQKLCISATRFIDTYKVSSKMLKHDIENYINTQRSLCIVDYITNGIPTIFQLSDGTANDREICTKIGSKFQVITGAPKFYNSTFYHSLTEKQVWIETGIEELKEKLKSNLNSGSKYRINISGKINGTDIISLIEYSYALIRNGSFLEELNLAECKIMAGGDSYHYAETKWATCEYFTSDNILSKFIFNGLFTRILTTPNYIERIEKYALSYIPTLEILNIDAGKLERECISNCKYLKQISFSGNLNRISSGAIFKCSNISSIQLTTQGKIKVSNGCLLSNNKIILFIDNKCESFIVPSNIVEIGVSAFYGKKNLKTITLNNGLKKIAEMAFYNSGIIELHIPVTVEQLGKNFIPYELENLYVYSNIVCPVPVGTFSCMNNTTLHIPKGASIIYANTKNWMNFKEYIDEPYTSERYDNYINHVTSYQKASNAKSALTAINRFEIKINDLKDYITFLDFEGSVFDFIQTNKSHFLLLLRHWKFDISNQALEQLEKSHLFNKKGINLITRIIDNMHKYAESHVEVVDYQEEPDYDRDTYYALGGNDYDAFKESGGSLDDMMVGMGF